MAILEIGNITKRFGSTLVLDDISFSVEKGEAYTIIGSSGSGKTTLLRCLNFLEIPDRGSIRVNGRTIFDADDLKSRSDSEIRRNRLHFGLVFQSFNLFPQYTTLRNVTLACELLAQDREDYKTKKKEILKEIEDNARRLLDQVGLSDKLESYPYQLSGGQ